MVDPTAGHQHGLLQSAIQDLLERTRTVTQLMGSIGTGARGAVPDVVRSVNTLLAAQQRLLEFVPPIPDIDVVVLEMHAKRLALQALQAELAAFDHQLELLEKALAPLEGWVREWTHLRSSLTNLLDAPDDEPNPDG